MHFMSGIALNGIVSIVCEAAPLVTIRSYGIPSKCPICAAEWPVGKTPQRRLTGDLAGAIRQTDAGGIHDF
jgi:hypothetical protein